MIRLLLSGLLFFLGQPACATVIFDQFHFHFYTYAEAGGTGADGLYHGTIADLTGQAGVSTLPLLPLEDHVSAHANFSDASGALLASAGATGKAHVDIQSASDIRWHNEGSSSVWVTAAGGLDPNVFAGASPMYAFVTLYHFGIDAPTQMQFDYASSGGDYQTQFSLGGPTFYTRNLSGSIGSLSALLAPGVFELYMYDNGYGAAVLTGAGARDYTFTRDYALKLSSAVPELPTWSMLIAGMAMAGTALRRPVGKTKVAARA